MTEAVLLFGRVPAFVLIILTLVACVLLFGYIMGRRQ